MEISSSVSSGSILACDGVLSASKAFGTGCGASASELLLSPCGVLPVEEDPRLLELSATSGVYSVAFSSAPSVLVAACASAASTCTSASSFDPAASTFAPAAAAVAASA
eukprot:6204987-Pleurochrysis_carterae.AAC.1